MALASYSDIQREAGSGDPAEITALLATLGSAASVIANAAVPKAWGCILVEDGAAAQALSTGVEAKLTGFAAIKSGAVLTTPSHSDDSIQVTNAGTYLLLAHLSMEANVSNLLKVYLAVDGVHADPGAHLRVSTSSSNIALMTVAVLTAGQKVTVRANAGADMNLTMVDCQLTVLRIA